MRRRPALTALLVLLAAAPAPAEVVVLKDGRRIPGDVVERSAERVVVETRLGRMTFARSDVVEILDEKTPREEYAEREAAARTAAEFFELGNWARGQRLTTQAKQAWRRAIELEPDHEGARTALGHVRYRGEWMSAERRDELAAADHEEEQRARGLVRHGDRWVTPEERARLEQGLELVDGVWLDPDEARRARGLERYGESWIPRPEWRALTSIDEVEELVAEPLDRVLVGDVALAGTWPEPFLREVGEQLASARAWFDAAWEAPPGLALLGDRPAEFYLFGVDPEPYLRSAPLLGRRTPTTPGGWEEAVAQLHGFYWWDPYATSSARLWHREELHLTGHCLHHWGHLLLNRLGFDGSFLPPWYDEGVAALCEFRAAKHNTIFCRARSGAGEGTGAESTTQLAFDPRLVRAGRWREAVRKALGAGQVAPFDRMAGRDLGDLELLDVAVSMAILEWLEQLGDGALARFHRVLRERAPRPPARVIEVARDRQAAYDAAFEAACGAGWREADARWRAWFLDR